MEYLLMHKDDVCGSMSFDDKNGRLIEFKELNKEFCPYLGYSNLTKIKQWWEMRAVPASRTAIQGVIRNAGCINNEMYLAKNLALSMTDNYWVCPIGVDLKFNQVHFSNLFDYTEGNFPYHSSTSYDANASLGGQMEKYWDLSGSVPVLVKESSKFYGQQSINEVFASYIHRLQPVSIPYVQYTAEKIERIGIVSRCEAFTSKDIEFIPAYEVVESQKVSNDISLYNHYIEVCVKNGIDREVMQSFMDYQTMTDFIISNTDEHLMNFGVLRDANSMKLIFPAPIFDSGNSMFYNENRTIPYSRAGLLERNITSFYKTEDKMLAKVKNRNIVDLECLPSAKETKEFYIKAGISEQKAEFISRNYQTKIEMVREFQLGKNFSLYQEKEREKNVKRNYQKLNLYPQRFIMICGLPGTGKSKIAQEYINHYRNKNFPQRDISTSFTIHDAIEESKFILDKKKVLSKALKDDFYENSVVLISANDIRKEFREQGMKEDNNLVFFIAQMRTKIALISGATVIYDASNISPKTRSEFLEIAKECAINNTEICVTSMEYFNEKTNISIERFNYLKEQFTLSYPSVEEGWSVVNDLNSEHEKNK